MLEKFIYETNFGRRFTGLENGVYLNYNTLRDYKWNYEQINGRISRFFKSVTGRKLPLVIYADTEKKALEVKNKLLEIAETDIEALRPGRIYVGDYYTNGFITGSEKKKYLINKRICYIDLTFTSEDPSWYKEHKHSFFASGSEGFTGVTEFPYDYPWGYSLPLVSNKIVSDAIGSSAFRLVIYGEVDSPVVRIGGHDYGINGKINAGETLTIDSVAKTITLTKASGENANWFDHRSRDSYIFEPIKAGVNTVEWAGDFGFELTVIEKRSEPRWT